MFCAVSFIEVFAVFDCCNLRIAVHTLLSLYVLLGVLYPFAVVAPDHMLLQGIYTFFRDHAIP